MLHVSQRKVLLGPVPAVDILDQHVLAGLHRDHFGTITCREAWAREQKEVSRHYARGTYPAG